MHAQAFPGAYTILLADDEMGENCIFGDGQ